MFAEPYTLSTFRRLANPAGVRGVIRHVGVELNRKYHRRFVDHPGCDVVEEDWDNLLILDGCRYDVFEEVCDLDGDVGRRRSHASDSNGFMQANFVGRTLHDTVYVTGNPYAASIPSETFHYVDNLVDSGWDEALGTVPPEVLATATLDVHRNFGNKRLIAHFMQPHYPFIGDLGREIETGRIEPDRSGVEFGHTIWQQLKYGLTDLTEERVWEAYAENLAVVLGCVRRLSEELPGKTVLTSDHGNLVGDRLSPIPVRGYGHPPDLFVDPLTVVPWFVMDGDRRTVTRDDPVDTDRLEEGEVRDRLEALGYA